MEKKRRKDYASLNIGDNKAYMIIREVRKQR